MNQQFIYTEHYLKHLFNEDIMFQANNLPISFWCGFHFKEWDPSYEEFCSIPFNMN